jgi:hypothetical protein
VKLDNDTLMFLKGMHAALAVVALYNEETLYDEIVSSASAEQIVAAADEEGDAEWAGLVQFGYVTAGGNPGKKLREARRIARDRPSQSTPPQLAPREER